MKTPLFARSTIACQLGILKKRLTNTFASLTVLIVVASFPSCSSKSDEIQESFTKYASDNQIDKGEYQDILLSIQESKLKNKIEKDGVIDHSKVRAYLLTLSKRIELELDEKDIYDPNLVPHSANFNINVFLENSASMNGYVGVNSSFKTTIFKLLSDLRNFSAVDTLSLNYINSKAITIKENASRDDIDDFYKRLNPSDFRTAGGSVASTDIERMLKNLLDRVNEKTLNVFISDCVFSPGKTNAKKYLDGQYAAIYNDFTHAKNKERDLSVIILQCSSRFEGVYYDYLDVPHSNLDFERPYYIWFIGTEDQFKQLVQYGIYDLIKGGYKNKLVMQSVQTPFEPDYKILLNNKIGNFRLKEGSKGPLSDAEPSDRERNEGVFGFNVAADYSQSLQDPKYFSDTANYKLNTNYKINVESIAGNNDVSLKGYTHKLKLETKALRSENLNIEVIGKVPSWVYSTNSIDDSKIEFNEQEKSKTFGLTYLIEGVTDAYYPKSKANTISTLSISIKK
jgi:hypothetical protein